MDLSIVIPCYNENDSIDMLVGRLDQLLNRFNPDFKTELIFVDDGSVDKTYQKLLGTYHDRDAIHILRHEQNQGLGAALQTGLDQASGSFVATIDSDCTYDPAIIPDMLLKMEPDVDILTASPYAPDGQVMNVSPFQIFLSQRCSKMYRFILGSNIHTFTSMFRIYRRSALEKISFKSTTFLSMAEIIINAIQLQLNVQEYATTLSSRQFGDSKRKIMRLTLEHLKLMAGLLMDKKL